MDAHLAQTNARAALATGATGRGVRIGIVDSGVQRNHPTLSGRVLANYSYVDPRTEAMMPGGKLVQGKTYTVIARSDFLSWNPKDTQSLDVLSYAVTE